MTEPGRADASRTRIAGVVLLAVAGVAAVVGLLALGGEGPPSHEAAPTSSPPVALPGLTSSTGPVPGPPPDAVQPGPAWQPEGRRWARRSCRAPAPVVAAMWVVCRPSLGPSPVLLPAVCPPSPPVAPPTPVAAMRVACRLLPAVLPAVLPRCARTPGTLPGGGSPEGTPTGPGVASGGALGGVLGGAPGGAGTVGGAPGTPPGGGSPVVAPIEPGAVPGGGGAGGLQPGPVPVGAPGGAPGAPAVTVRVYNNSMITGLAQRAADELRLLGWNVTEVGNYPYGMIPESTVYFRPGTDEEGAAQSLAAQFEVRTLPSLRGHPARLTRSDRHRHQELGRQRQLEHRRAARLTRQRGGSGSEPQPRTPRAGALRDGQG